MADDTKDYQHEYLEWSVARDESDNVVIATFTCEGPEEIFSLPSNYFSVTDRSVLKIHGQSRAEHPLGPLSILESRFRRSDAGIRSLTGQPFARSQGFGVQSINRWNDSTKIGSIAHLVQRNNTLSAEIDIAGQATVIRKDPQGKIVTNEAQLTRCSQYGNAGRNSDPSVSPSLPYAPIAF